MSRPDAAIEQLTNHQEQLDADGVMVGVSRQALDETLAYIAALSTQERAGDVERLRRALERIAGTNATGLYGGFRKQCVEIARAALKEQVTP